MKIVYNRFIPFGRFTALTVLVWLFVKEGVALTARLLNHEKIHMRQQLEIVAVCLLGTVAAHLLFGVPHGGCWRPFRRPCRFTAFRSQ